MTLEPLRKKIGSDATRLTQLIANVTENQSDLAKVQAQLEKIREERSQLESERTQIENASAVSLHRMGLTSEEAAKRSDELKAKIESIAGRENGIDARRAELQALIPSDYSELSELINHLNHETMLLSQAEFVALLASIIDTTSIDIAWNLEHNWPLFKNSYAIRAYERRKDLIKRANSHADPRAEVLRIAEEIAANPIVALRQAGEELPDSTSALVREVAEY